MAIDNDKIKSALDDFEADDFIAAKDTLKAEIKGAIQDYYKDKLGLEKDLVAKPEKAADTED